MTVYWFFVGVDTGLLLAFGAIWFVTRRQP